MYLNKVIPSLEATHSISRNNKFSSYTTNILLCFRREITIYNVMSMKSVQMCVCVTLGK